jgi:hypothetical protein
MYPSLREAKKRNNKFPEKQYLSVSRPRFQLHDADQTRALAATKADREHMTGGPKRGAPNGFPENDI